MTSQRLIQTTAAALVAASALQPASAWAAEQTLQISSDADARRIEIAPTTAVPESAWVGVLPGGAMVSRFAVELLDPVLTPAGSWSIELSATLGGMAVRIARFDTGNAELVLPKPLGFRFDTGDSITIRVLGAIAPRAWRIVADYEPLEGPISRIAVLPMAIDADTPDHSADAQSWRFAAPVAGRILAVAGLASAAGAELSMADEESGASLWRETVSTGSDEAFGCAQGVVRAGVMIRAEHSYRFTVAGAGEAGGRLVVYVLPVAAPSLARSN
jgi:hypothetical protein